MVVYFPEIPFDKSQANYKRDSYSNKLKYSICRIVFRTPVLNLRSDFNALDIFTSSVLGADRYDVASNLYELLNKTFVSKI